MIIASLYHGPYDVQLAHDMNASIIKDEKIYAYEEEKLTGIKNETTVKFAERSLLMGCKELNIYPADIDEWVFPTLYKKIDLKDYFFFFTEVIKAYSNTYENFTNWYNKHVHFVEHHFSHASLAVFASSFSECAFLTKDGGGDLGDQRGFTFGEFKNGRFNVIKERVGADNLSLFHDYLTDSIGFAYFENGKTSGLAAYGDIQPQLLKSFKDLLSITENGIKFDAKRYSKTGTNLQKIHPSEYNRNKIFRQYPGDSNIYRLGVEYLLHDIAGTGEYALKTFAVSLVEELKKHTSMENLVCGGGLFQNVALNYSIVESKIFKKVFVPMGPSDSGLALGAALYIQHKLRNTLKKRNWLLSPFLGPSFSKDEIRNLLDRFRLIYHESDNISKETAQLVADGKVVGWFQGRGEYGPRSLGNRSILADPRRKESKSRINQLLKKREWFMPYAPSIIEEYLHEWVDLPQPSPYMQIAFQILESKRDLIPAAVHVDGSSRVNVVSYKDNERFWKLIDYFRELTEIPVVLNTSFNRHGIATISTPRQAVEHLLEGCMDFLAIDDFVINFAENRLVSRITIHEKSESVHLAEDNIRRLVSVCRNGKEEQQIKYLARLSQLIGIELRYQNHMLWVEDEGELSIENAVEILLQKINQ